jgi:hypothetical protein
VFDQANKLAEKYDKKSRYFLDCIFQGGSHMVNHQHEVNTYNAFKSEKAAELRAGKYFLLLQLSTAPTPFKRELP